MLSKSENQDIKQSALEESVRIFENAIAKQDFDKLLNLLYLPKEVEDDLQESDEKKEQETAVVKQLFDQSEASGLTFSIKLKSPQKIINSDTNLFSIVPQETLIKISEGSSLKDSKGQLVPSGEYKANGYYIAISEDNGKTWKFWDGVLSEDFKKLFPDAAKKMDFPKIQKPFFMD